MILLFFFLLHGIPEYVVAESVPRASDSHLFSFSLTHGYDLKSVVQK